MAILLVVLVPAAMAVLAGGVVLVLVAAFGRAEADPEGRRGEGVYLGAVAFVSIYLVLFATFGAVASLASLLGHQLSPISALSSSSSAPGLSYASSGGASPPFTSLTTSVSSQIVDSQSGAQNGIFVAGGPSRTDEAITGVLASGLVAFAGVGVLAYHRRRLESALVERGNGSLARVMATYRRLVSFVGVFIAALAAAVALFGIYRLIAPGMSGSSGRSGGAEELIDAGYLALASGWLVRFHRPGLPEAGLADEAT